jgi:hypothetical protein
MELFFTTLLYKMVFQGLPLHAFCLAIETVTIATDPFCNRKSKATNDPMEELFMKEAL